MSEQAQHPKHARPSGLSYKNKSIFCCHACEKAAGRPPESERSWVHWEAVDEELVAHICSGGMTDPMLCGAIANESWWWAV